MFSKKRLYWMVLMPVYMETAEGLVKPLVILPAAVMPLSFLSLFSHDIIVPFVLADSFILTTHFTPCYIINHSHAHYRLCSLLIKSTYCDWEHFLFMAEQCS